MVFGFEEVEIGKCSRMMNECDEIWFWRVGEEGIDLRKM